MSVIPIQTNSFKVADFSNVSSGVDASLQEINFFNTVTISSGNDVNGTYLTVNGGYAERMVGGSGANSVTVTCKEITPNCISVIEIRNATNTQTLAKRKIGHTTVAQKVVIKVPDGIYGKYVKMYSESGTFALYSIHGIESKEAAYEATPDLSDMPLTDIHQGTEYTIRFSYNGKYSILGNDYYPVLQNDGTWKVSSTAKSIDSFSSMDGWDHISDIGWHIDWYTANSNRCAYITDEGVAIDWNWGTLTHFATSTKFGWLTDDIFITWPWNTANPTLKIYRFIAPDNPSAGGTFTDANFVKLSEYQITVASSLGYVGRMVSPNKKYFCLAWGSTAFIIKFTDDFTSVVHVTSVTGSPMYVPGFYTVSNDGLQLLLPEFDSSLGWCIAYWTRPDDTSDFTLVESTKNGVSKLFPGNTQGIGVVRFTADNKLLFLEWNANKVSKYNNVYTNGNGFEVIETKTLGYNSGNVSYTYHDINIAGTLIGVAPNTTSVEIYGNTIGNFNKLPAIDGSAAAIKLADTYPMIDVSQMSVETGVPSDWGVSTISKNGKYFACGAISPGVHYLENGSWTINKWTFTADQTTYALYFNNIRTVSVSNTGWIIAHGGGMSYLNPSGTQANWSGAQHMGIARHWIKDNMYMTEDDAGTLRIVEFIPPANPTTGGTLSASNFNLKQTITVPAGVTLNLGFRQVNSSPNGNHLCNGLLSRIYRIVSTIDNFDTYTETVFDLTANSVIITNTIQWSETITNDGLTVFISSTDGKLGIYKRESISDNFTIDTEDDFANIMPNGSDYDGGYYILYTIYSGVAVLKLNGANSKTYYYSYDGTTFTLTGTLSMPEITQTALQSNGGLHTTFSMNDTGSVIGTQNANSEYAQSTGRIYGTQDSVNVDNTVILGKYVTSTNPNKFVDLTSTDETVISSGYDLSLQEITYNITGSISGIDTNYTVTVQNVSGQNVFFLNGVQQKTLTLLKGETYTFTQTDSSNTAHEIKIVSDALNGSTDATGYTYTGTAGNDGSGSFTVPSNAPDTLYYRCVNHENMGGTIKVIENYNLGRPLLVEGTGYLEKTLVSSDTTVSIRYRKASAGTTTFQVLNADQTDVLAEAKITQTLWPQKVVLGFSSGVGNVLRVNENGTGEFYEMLGNTVTEFLTEDISSSTGEVVTVDPMTQDIPGPKPYYYDSAKRTILHGNVSQGNYYMSKNAGGSLAGVLTTDTINGQTVDVYEQNAASHYQYFDAEHVMYALSATFKSTKPISGYNDRPHYICSFITDTGGYYTSVQFDNGYLSLRAGASSQYEFAKGRIAVKSQDWNTVIMVKDYSQLRIKVYLNGYLDIDFTYSENSVYNDKSLSTVSPIVYSDGMMQGGWWMQNAGNGSSTNFFKMYEIRAWDRPLSDAEAFEASIIQDTPYYMYQDFSTVSSALALHTDGWNSKFIDGGNTDSSLLIESATDGMKFSGSGTNGYEISKTIPDDTTHVRVIGHAIGSGVVQVKNESGTVVAETNMNTTNNNWYLYQNFGTSNFVDDGSHGGSVDTTQTIGGVTNNLSYSPLNISGHADFTSTGEYTYTHTALSDNTLFFGYPGSATLTWTIPNGITDVRIGISQGNSYSGIGNTTSNKIEHLDSTGSVKATYLSSRNQSSNPPLEHIEIPNIVSGDKLKLTEGHDGQSTMFNLHHILFKNQNKTFDLTFSSGTGNTLHIVKSSGSPGTVELSKVLLNSRETDGPVKYCLNIDQSTGDYVNNVTWSEPVILTVSDITASSFHTSSADVSALTDGVIEGYYPTTPDGIATVHTNGSANPEYLEFTLDTTSIVTSVVMYRGQLNYLTRNNNYTIKLLDSTGALLEEKNDLSYTSDDLTNNYVSKHPSFFTEGIGKLTTTFTNGVSASKVRIENYSTGDRFIVLSEVQIYGSTPFIQPSILGDNYYAITKASGDSLHASVTYKDYHMFMALTASGPSTLLSYNDSSNTNKTMTFSSFSSPWERVNAKATLTNGDIVYGQDMVNDNNASSSPSNAFNATNDGVNFWQSGGGGGGQEIGYEFQSGPKTITSMKFTQNNYQTSNLLAHSLSIKYWNGSAWTPVSNASATGFPVDQQTQLGQVTITFDAAESQYWVVDVHKLNAYSSIGEWELHGPPQKILDFGTTKWTISSGTLNAYDNSGTQQLARPFSVGSGFFVLELHTSGFAKVHSSGEVQFSTVSASSINSLTFSSDTEVNIGDLYIYESISDSDRTALLNTLYTKWNTSTTVPASKVPVISIDGDNNDSLQSPYTLTYSADRATLLSPGYRGSGINLTTATNYLQTNVTLKNTSLSFWFKLTGSHNMHHSLINFRDSSGTEKAHFYTGDNSGATYQRDGMRFYELVLNAGIEPLTKAQRPRDASTWYHMCLTCDEYGVVKLYENGYMYADDVFTDTVKNGSIYDYHICLGKFSSYPGALYDDIKVYKGVLTQEEVTALASVSKPPTTLLGNSTDYINNGAGSEKLSPYSVNDYTPVSGATGALAGMTLYIEPPRAIHSGTKIYADIPTSTFVSGGYRNIWSLIDASTNAEMTAVFTDTDKLDVEIVIEFPYAIDVSSVTHTNRAHASYPNQDKDIDKIEYWDGSAYQTITTTPTTPWTNPDGAQGTKYDFVFSSIIKAQYFKISYSGGRVIGELELHSSYKYLGFYTTSISNDPYIYELLMDYTGGTIRLNSTEEIGATNTEIINAVHEGYGMTFNAHAPIKLFDSNTSITAFYMTPNGTNKFYFYIELDTPIPDVTAFTYWTFNNGYSFNNLSIYGTNTDPNTMGTGGSDMNTITGNWTLLAQGTQKLHEASYP